MNKAELVDMLAGRYCGGNRSEAMRILNAVVETIIDATAEQGRVSITGFGVFETMQRPERTVRNPRTGERKRVPAEVQPRFRPGSRLIRSVAEAATSDAAEADAPAPGGTPAPVIVTTKPIAADPVAARGGVGVEPVLASVTGGR